MKLVTAAFRRRCQRRRRVWRALSIGVVALTGLLGLATPAAGEKIEIDPSRLAGSAAIYRPSVMLSWADAEAITNFLALPGDLGTVRITLEPLLTQASSGAEFNAQLGREAPQLKALFQRRARVVVTVARTPKWLASEHDERSPHPYGFTRREAAPARDLSSYGQLGADIAAIIRAQTGYSPWYEFWNEPESDAFWKGTSGELFDAYAAFAEGIKRADPSAKVGGIAVGSYADVRNGTKEPPLLQAFINDVAKRKAPLDFVSWHNFGKHPEEGWAGAAEIRLWLKQAGLTERLPQLVTEWNLWSTHPDWFDPMRDSMRGAAYMVAAIGAMERAGVHGHTLAALQDFNAGDGKRPAIGDFGVLTRNPMLAKPSFRALQLLAKLEPDRLTVDLPDHIAEAAGIGMFATRSGTRIAVLLYRYGQDYSGAFIRALQRSGFERFEQLKLSQERLVDFSLGKRELKSGEVPDAVHKALVKARSASERARSEGGRDISITLAIKGWTNISYRIVALQDRVSATSAKEDDPTVVKLQSGKGTLPDITLPVYGVTLLIADQLNGASVAPHSNSISTSK